MKKIEKIIKHKSEEFAVEFVSDPKLRSICKNSFELGAKWLLEKTFSTRHISIKGSYKRKMYNLTFGVIIINILFLIIGIVIGFFLF